MKEIIIALLVSLSIVFSGVILPITKAMAFTSKPVDLNFDLIPGLGLPVIGNVGQMISGAGVESRNTSNSNEFFITPGDTSVIDGVFVIDSFKNYDGVTIFGTDINITWEMTGTYTALSDLIFEADADKYSYITAPQVGILTFYVSTDMSQRANPTTGQGYTDGTMVAQYAVFNPQPDPANYISGGVMKLVDTFDGSRDMIMVLQSGIEGFITSTNDPSEEMTALLTDHNLDADSNNDGVPSNSPVPEMWSPPTVVNWPFSFFTENDGSFRFGTVPVPPDGSCRMTGGGNDTNGNIVLGTLATSEGDRYTYGGQIGAPTADQPQPSGEWTHHQQKGVGDKFIFRSGTASAPKDTKILRVFCQDPCYCVNARPAPFKQISWDGTGHFANISPKGLNQLNAKCGNGISAGKDGSRHYYRVHVNDIGEPGSGGLVSKGKGKKSTRSQCDLDLGTFPDLESPYSITEEQCADCPDTYQIEIHCTTDPASDVMYSVGAFVEGGNLQIHPPVGDHMTPGMCP